MDTEDAEAINSADESAIIHQLSDLLHLKTDNMDFQQNFYDYVNQTYPTATAMPAPVERILNVKNEDLNKHNDNTDLVDEKIYAPLQSIGFEQLQYKIKRQSTGLVSTSPTITNTLKKLSQNDNQNPANIYVVEKQNLNNDEQHTEQYEDLNVLNKNLNGTSCLKYRKVALKKINQVLSSAEDSTDSVENNESKTKKIKSDLKISKNNYECYDLRNTKRRRKLAKNRALAAKGHKDMKESTNNDSMTKEDTGADRINDENIFVRPITPARLHITNHNNNNEKSEESGAVQFSPQKQAFTTNLTDEEKLLLSSNIDISASSDSEFEQICHYIRNENPDPAQLSFNTIDLLNEFKDIDQSTNEKLLADLLDSPQKLANISFSGECSNNNNNEIGINNKIKTEGIVIPLKCMETSNEPLRKTSKRKRVPVKRIGVCSEPSRIIRKRKQTSADRIDESDGKPLKKSSRKKGKIVSSELFENNYEKSPVKKGGKKKKNCSIIQEIRYKNKEEESNSHDDDHNLSDSDDLSSIDIEDIKRQVANVSMGLAIREPILKKLKTFKVNLEDKAPPQHQLERQISRPISAQNALEFEKYASLKKECYTAEEDTIIKENWKRFCEVHDWNVREVKPFLRLRYRGKSILPRDEPIKFAQFLAKGLPSRTLHSVLARFRALYEDKDKRSTVRKSFTSKEDEIIWKYFEDKTIKPRRDEKAKKLATFLGRQVQTVTNRYALLKKHKKISTTKEIKKTVKWDMLLIKKFIKKLLKVAICEDIEELKDAHLPFIIWKKLEKKLKISQDTLHRYWTMQLHMQFFYKGPIFRNQIKVMLIEWLYSKGISDRTELNWAEVGEQFDGIPDLCLSKIFWDMVKMVPNRSNLANVIEHLYEKKIPYYKSLKSEPYLPNLSYNNGQLEIIDMIAEETHCDDDYL